MQGDMRKAMTFALMIVLAICGSGCFRITKEILRDDMQPPKRFYAGTKTDRMATGFVMSNFKKEPFATTLFSVPLLIDFPLEVVTDTLLLPLDGLLYRHYNKKPPLDKLLYNNDLEGLKARLDKGADPNAVSSWFIYHQPVIQTALQNQQEEFFNLLLSHGAKLPFGILERPADGNTAIDKIGMLKKAFANGCPPELLQHEQAQYVVSEWILKILETPYRATSDDKALADFLIMLMDFGFSPKEWKGGQGGRPDYCTALDIVLKNYAMETEAKDRLVASMRAHGAKTYRELHNEKPQPSRLKTDGIAIAPIFQPVVDILKESYDAEHLRLTDKLDGVDGPVLVIEKPVYDWNSSNSAKKWLFRKTVKFRRRISQTEWSVETESIDVPAAYRIVLTEQGRKMPSRRPQGLPSHRGFWEAWYTLSKCELYVEHIMDCGERPEIDLLKICMLSIERDDKRELMHNLVFEPAKVEPYVLAKFEWPAKRCYGGFPLDGFRWQRGEISKEKLLGHTLETVTRANPALTSLGISPQWCIAVPSQFALSNGFQGDYYISTVPAFSTHRNLLETTSDAYPLAPVHPEEVIAVVNISSRQKFNHIPDFQFGREGKDYWNWKLCRVPYQFCSIAKTEYDTKPKKTYGEGYHDIFLFYGDSVKEERLEAIRKALETMFAPKE